MQITVNGQHIAIVDDTLVSNSVNIYECEFEFDSSWDGFSKTSVWQLNSDDPIEVVIDSGVAVIPHEVLENAGILRIGVYGTKDEKVMPTVWLEKRKVCLGTPTGSIGTEPTPSIYAQILAVATEAKDIAEEVQTEWESVSATAETLPSDASATASFDDGVFSFGIPKGEKGEQGEQGAKGDKGDTGAKGDKGDKGDTGEVSEADLEEALIDKADVILNSASGTIATFDDGADMPVKSLEVDINAVQDLHGQANPYPAGGGVNKLVECVAGTYTSANCTAIVSNDGTITISGTAGSSYEQIIIPLKHSVTLPNEQCYIQLLNTYNPSMAPSFELSTDVAGTNINGGCSPANRILTVAENRWGVTIDRIRFWIGANVNAAVTLHPMVTLTSTATAYAPYENICPISGWDAVNVVVSPTLDAEDGTTYPITLPSTCYGGKLDVVSGVLTLTHKLVTFTGNESWAYVAAYGGFRINLADANIIHAPNVDCKSNRFVGASSRGVIVPWEDGKIECYTSVADAKFIFLTTSITDTTEWKTWLANNPTQLLYPLEQPTILTLTSTEVSTVLGTNNLWADCGDVAVIYRADTKKYIDGTIVDVPLAMIAPIETGTTASKAYAVGEYFILNGTQFCKAKTAIASGATFTLNTNYTVTTIATELKALQ